MTWSHLCQCMVCAAPKRLLCSMLTACAAEPSHSAAGVRFLITWRERLFQCQIFGSRAWFIFAASARAAKITRILRKLWRTGQRIWFSSESKIKDCFLNQRRWTCWFCLCCLSHVTLWRLSLNVLYLFDSLVFAKRSGVAYASSYSFMLITLYKLVCSLLFYCCCAFQLRITMNPYFNHLF